MILLLCGHSGAGKTTFLNNFKNTFSTIDLDTYISNDLGEFIRKIGLEKFREIEKTKLLELCSKKDKLVIALGAGALTEDIFNKLISYKFITFLWIDTPFEISYNRVKNDKNRPLMELPYSELKTIAMQREEIFKKSNYRLSQLTDSIKFLSDIINM